VVDKGRLEFIETDANGRLLPGLELTYEPKEMTRFIALINSVWKRVMSLDFPETSKYPPTSRGILAFEEDLLSK